MRKSIAIALSTAYLQVNVVCAASPYMPAPANGFNNPVFVFHAFDPVNAPKPKVDMPARPVDLTPAEVSGGGDNESFSSRGQPVKDEYQLKGAGKFLVKENVFQAGPGENPIYYRPDMGNMRLGNINIGKLPVGDDVKAALREAGPNAKVNIRAEGGTAYLNIEGMGSIKLTLNGGGKPTGTVDRTMANTVSAAATKREAATTPAVLPEPKADAKAPAPEAPVTAPKAESKAAPVAPPPAEKQAPVEVQRGAANMRSLRDLGYNGRNGSQNVANIQGDGRWVVTRDPESGKSTRRFEGTVTWETSAGMKYTATATPEGKVQLTREATGTFRGKDVTQEGKVVEVDFGRGGKPVAATSMNVGDTETRVNGELTSFNAANGPILRQVMQPQQPRAGGGEGGQEPRKLEGARGEYVVREGNLDSVFKMAGGKVELDQIKDATTGNTLVQRFGNEMVGNVDGEAMRFQVLGGPRFDAATGQAQVSVNILANAGESRVLEAPKGGRGGGQDVGEGGADPRLAYNDVAFKDLGGGKFLVTAVTSDATMAGSLSLGSGKASLVQSSNIKNSVFIDKNGAEAGRTLDDVKVLDQAGKPVAGPPLIAMTTVDDKTISSYAAIGVNHTAPFVLPSGATGIKGTVQAGGEGTPMKGDISFALPSGATANLKMEDGKRTVTIDSRTASAPTTLDFGVAKLEVAAGKNATTDLDQVFADSPDLPDGVKIVSRVEVAKIDVDNLQDLGSNLDAEVVGSNVKAWRNPLTGNVQVSDDGVFQVKSDTWTGEITFKDGRLGDLKVQGNAGVPATVIKFNQGGGAQDVITLQGSKAVTIDLQNGTFKAPEGQALPDILDGATVQNAGGLSMSFSRDNTLPAGIAVSIDNDFPAFGQNISKDDVTAKFNADNGKVTIDFKTKAGGLLGLGGPERGFLQINGPIKVAEGPNGTLDNAKITRLETNIFGGMTGIGESELAEGQKVLVPGGAGGGASGGGAPDLSGTTMSNVSIEKADGGTLVTANAGGGKVVVSVQMNPGEEKLAGQVHLDAPNLDKVLVDGTKGPVSVGGVEFSGKQVVTKAEKTGEFSWTSTGKDSKAVTPGGVELTLPEGGKTITFIDGKLQATEGLDRATVKVDGNTFDLKATKVGDRTIVSGTVRGEMNTSFNGEAIADEEFRDIIDKSAPVKVKLEGGNFRVDLSHGEVISAYKDGGMVVAGTGDKLPAASIHVQSILYNAWSGEKQAAGTVGLGYREQLFAPLAAEGKSTGAGSDEEPPVGHINGGNKNVDFEEVRNEAGEVVGTLITPNGSYGAEVAGTFTETKKVTGPDGKETVVAGTFTPNLNADYSQNVRAGVGGYTFGGIRAEEGTLFNSHEMGSGRFSLTVKKGQTLTKEGSEPGKPELFLKATSDGPIAFDRGMVVGSVVGGDPSKPGSTDTLLENPGVPPSGADTTAFRYQRLPELTTTGSFEGFGYGAPIDAKNNPALAQVGETKPFQVQINGGIISLTGGTVYRNETGGDVVIKGADGKDTNLRAQKNTQFTWTGTSLFAGRQVTDARKIDAKGDADSGHVVMSLGDAVVVPPESQPESVKGKAGVAVENQLEIVFGAGGERVVQSQTYATVDGKREALGSPVMMEAQKTTVAAGSTPEKPVLKEVRLYRARNDTQDKGWALAGGDSIELDGKSYSVKQVATDAYGYQKRGRLDVSEASLEAAVGTNGTVVLDSGEVVKGYLSRSNTRQSDGTTKRREHSFYVRTNPTVAFSGDNGGDVKRTGVELVVKEGNVDVSWTNFSITGDDGKKSSFFFNNQTRSIVFVEGGTGPRIKDETMEIKLNGNTINVVADAAGKQTVSTDLQGPAGSRAFVLTTAKPGLFQTSYEQTRAVSAGMHIGTIHQFAPGATMLANGNRLDVGGKKVLAQEVTVVDKNGRPVMENVPNPPGTDKNTITQRVKTETSFLFTQDTRLDTAIIGAGGRAGVDDKGVYALRAGYVRTEGGNHRFAVGYRTKNGDNVRVAPGGAGGAGDSAGGKRDTVVFHYEQDGQDRQKMIMTRGETFIGDGAAYFKAGTKFVNEDLTRSPKDFDNPNRVRLLNQDGSFTQTVKSYASGTPGNLKSKQDAIAADIRSRAKDMKLDRGEFKTNDAGGVDLVVLDAEDNVAFNWSTKAARETNWTGLIGTGKDYLENGVLFTTEQVIGENADGTRTYAPMIRYRDGKDGEMVRDEGTKTEHRYNDQTLKGTNRTVDAIADKTEWKGGDGENEYQSVTTILQGPTKMPDGTVIRSNTRTDERINNMKGYDFFESGAGANGLSDDKRQQLKENRKSFFDSIGKPGGESYMGDADNQLNFITDTKQKIVFANYSRRDKDSFEGITDFYLMANVAANAWGDVLGITDGDSAGRILRGEEKQNGLLGLIGDGKFRANSLKDMDAYGEDLDRMMAGESLDTIMGDFGKRQTWSGNFWRKLDTGAGELIGWNRIMRIPTHEVVDAYRRGDTWGAVKSSGKVAGMVLICSVEQALNFVGFGGGALLNGGTKAAVAGKTLLVTARGAQMVNAAQKASLAYRAGRVVGQGFRAGKAVAQALKSPVSKVGAALLTKGKNLYNAGGILGNTIRAGVWTGGKAKALVGGLINNKVTQTALQLHLRNTAFNSIEKAVDVSFEKGIGSSSAIKAWGQAGKDFALSEFAFVMGALGSVATSETKLAKAVQAVTGFGSKSGGLWATTRQVATVAAIGGGLGAVNHYANNQPGNVLTSAGIGAASAVAGFSLFRALGAGASGVSNMINVSKGTEAVAATAQAGSKLAGLGNLTRAFLSGAGTNLTLKYLSGDLTSENAVKTALQGGFVGVLGFAVLKAAGNWGKVGRDMKEGMTLGETFTKGAARVNEGRINLATGITAWEGVFNSVEWNGEVGWGGGSGLANPLTWVSAISKTIEGTGILGPSHGPQPKTGGIFTKANFERLKGTWLTMATISPTFSLTAVYTNALTALPMRAMGALTEKSAANIARAIGAKGLTGKAYYAGAAALQGAGASLLNKVVIMPLNIKTFEAFERGGVQIAFKLDLAEHMKADADGKMYLTDDNGEFLKGENGAKIEASAEDVAIVKAVETASFLAAPGHAHPKHSTKVLGEKVAEASPRFADLVAKDGGAGRRKGALDAATEIRRASGEVLNGGEPINVIVNGERVQINSGNAAEIGAAATNAIGRDTAFRGEVAKYEAGQVAGVVHDGKSARAIVETGKAEEGRTEVTWTAGKPEGKIDGAEAKATGAGATGGTDFKATVEVTRTAEGGKTEVVRTNLEAKVDGGKVTVEAKDAAGKEADASNIVVVRLTVVEGEGTRDVIARGTMAEARAGLKIELPAGTKPADVSSLRVEMAEMTDGRAARILANKNSAPGEGPTRGLIDAAAARLGVAPDAVVIGVDASLHNVATASHVANLSNGELTETIKNADMPTTTRALASGRLAENSIPVPGLKLLAGTTAGEILGLGKRARTEFLAAANAGVSGENLTRVGLGNGVKTIQGERVVVDGKGEAVKVSEAISPEALARLPDSVRSLEAGSDRSRVVLAPAGTKLVFENVKSPATVFTNGVPKSGGETSTGGARSPPGASGNPWTEVAKNNIFDSSKGVDLAVVVDGTGAVGRVEASRTGDKKGGPSVILVEGAVGYRNLNGTQADVVMQNSGTGTAAVKAAEAEIVTAQANGGLFGKRTVNIDVSKEGVVDAVVGRFQLSSVRPSIESVYGAKGPAGSSESVVGKAAQRLLAGDRSAARRLVTEGAKIAEGKSNRTEEDFLADIGAGSRNAKGLSGEAKGEAFAQVRDEIQAERDATIAAERKAADVKIAADPANADSISTAFGKRKGEIEAEYRPRLTAAEKMYWEIATRGCSACLATFKNPMRIAEAAEGGALRRLLGDLKFLGSERVGDGFVADRIAVAALESGTSRAEIRQAVKNLKDAAKELKERGNERDALILEVAAERLETGKVESVEVNGERIGRAESDYISAEKAYHQQVVDLAKSGASPSRMRRDATLKERARTLIDVAGTGATIKAVEGDIKRIEGVLKTAPEDSKGPIRQALATLKHDVAALKRDVTRGDRKALDKVRALEPLTDTVLAQIGAKELDAAKIRDLRTEIEAMPDGPARTAMSEILEATVKHSRDYANSDAAGREKSLGELTTKFAGIREAYAAEYKARTGKDLKMDVLVPLFPADLKRVSVETRNGVIAEMFGPEKTYSNLNAGERLAFNLAVSEAYFTVKDAPAKAGLLLRGKSFELSVTPPVRKSGESRRDFGKRVAKHEKDLFDTGKRAATLVQFMLGRVAGLEAGGGKTALFPMGIAEYAMRVQKRGDAKPIVAELIVFKNGEVQQYLDTYQPLFRALGLEAVDGRNLNGKNEATVKAYTAEAGVTKVIVSDMNTRGFRQNDVEREPGSVVDRAIRDNVRIKAGDEIDAQVLSRMAFINSDGNLVAKREMVSYTESIGAAATKALGVKGLAELADLSYASGGKGFRQFEGSAVETLRDGKMWFAKEGETTWVSQALLTRVESILKAEGKEVTSGEIIEFFRAVSAIKSPTEFGFSNATKETGAKEEGAERAVDKNFRPTHKKDGEFQVGQIDSSPIFNVAAVLMKRAQLTEKGESLEGYDLGDIRLSKASASATLIQAFQGGKNVHRFAATGTPEALEGIVQATLGLELGLVYSSSRSDFQVLGAGGKAVTVAEAYAARKNHYDAGGRVKMTVDFVEASGLEARAGAAVEAIVLSQSRGKDGAGILIGARQEADLKATFVRMVETVGGAEGAKLAAHLRSKAMDGGIREVVREAKRVLLASEKAESISPELAGLRSNKTLVDHVNRTDVADGNGGKGTQWYKGGAEELASSKVAENTQGERKIVFSTEEGLRGRNYTSREGKNDVDAVFMGLEMVTTESRMQAWKRVDRDRNAAVRIEIVDTAVLRRRVETAKNLDGAMKKKFGRPDGLFRGDPALRRVLETKDVKDMSHAELIHLAGGLSSLENLGQASMFFINEQVEAKLLKEPITRYKAMEKTAEGKKFLEDLQVDILEHSDKKKIDQGTEFTDPKTQALQAFNSASGRTITYLTRIVNNKNVSLDIRMDAATRIADIVDAQHGLMRRLQDVNPATGLHEKTRYQEAAFVSVSRDVRARPATQVADTVVRLSDLLLPNTRTGKDVAGAKGAPVTAARTATSGAARTAVPKGANVEGRDMSFLDSVVVTKPGEKAAPKTAAPAEVLSYREQALYSALSTFDDMDEPRRDAVLPALVDAGLVDAASAAAGDNRLIAASLVSGLTDAGVREDQIDVSRVLQVAEDLKSLAPEGATLTADIVVNAALDPNAQEGIANALVRINAEAPAGAPSSEAALPLAAKVSQGAALAREQDAALGGAPSGTTIGSIRHVVTVAGNALFNSGKRQLKAAGKTTLAAAVGEVPMTTDGRVDRPAVARRLAAFITLATNATGEDRDKALQTVATLAALAESDPAALQEGGLFSRLTFNDLVATANADDPIAALQAIVKKKDVSFLYRPIELPPAAKAAASTAGALAGVAGLAAATMLGAPILGTGLIIGAVALSALGTDTTKDDPMTGMMKKMLPSSLGSVLPESVTKALPTVGTVIGAIAFGLTPWAAASTGANYLGGLLGADKLGKIPVIGKAWQKLTATPVRFQGGSSRAVTALERVAEDIQADTEKAFAADPEIRALEASLKTATPEEKTDIQQKIEARKDVLRSDGTIPGFTLRRLADKIDEMMPNATREEKAKVFKAALLLKSGARDEKSIKRADDLAAAYENKENSEADAEKFAALENAEVIDLFDTDYEMEDLVAIGNFERGLDGEAVTIEAIEAHGGWETATSAGEENLSANDVIRYFANNENLTDAEIGAMRTTEKNEAGLKSALPVTSTPDAADTSTGAADRKASTRNDVAPLAAAVTNNGVHRRAADVVQASNARPEVKVAARRVADTQSRALGQAVQILSLTGADPEQVRNLQAVVVSNPRMNARVNAAIDALYDDPAAPGAAMALPLVREALESYYNASAVGIAAVSPDGTPLSTDEVAILVQVSNPAGTTAGRQLVSSWEDHAPFYQAASVMRPQGPFTLTVSGDAAVIAGVPLGGGEITSANIRKESWGVAMDLEMAVGVPGTDTKAPFKGTVELRTGPDGVRVIARGAGANVLQSRSTPAAEWAPVSGTRITAGHEFRFVPTLSAGATADQKTLVVFKAPDASTPRGDSRTESPPSNGDPSAATDATDDSPTADAPAPRPVVPVEVGALYDSLRDEATEPARLLEQANRVFPVDSAPGTSRDGASNLAVARASDGAIVAIWARGDEDGDWRGAQAGARTGDETVRTDAAPTPPAGVDSELEFYSWNGAEVRRVDSVDAAVDAPPAAAAAAPRPSFWRELAARIPWSRRATVAGALAAMLFGVSNTASAADPTGTAQAISAGVSFGAAAFAFLTAGSAAAVIEAGLNRLGNTARRTEPAPAAPPPDAPDPGGAFAEAAAIDYERPDGRAATFSIGQAVMDVVGNALNAPVERMIAVFYGARTDGARTIYEATGARPVRTLTFLGAPAQGSGTLRELARALDLGEVAAPEPGRIDDAAVDAVRALAAPGGEYAGWMSRILVAPLLGDLSPEQAAALRADPRYEASFARLSAPSATLADVEAMGNEDFTRLVYNLVAFNAESISTRRGILLTGNTYRRLWENGPVALMHTHLDGQARRASLADRLSAMAVSDFESENGLEGPGLMLIGSQDADGQARVIGFNAVQDNVLRAPDERIPEVSRARFESFSVELLAGEGEPSSLLGRMAAPFRRAMERLGLLPNRAPLLFDMSNPADRQAAEVTLKNVWGMTRAGLDSRVVRTVFMAAFALHTGRVNESDVDAFVNGMDNRGIDLGQVIRELSRQYVVTGMARAGETGELVGVVRGIQSMVPRPDQFGAVAAMPADGARLFDAEKGFILNRMGRIRLNVMDVRTAAARRDAAGRRLKSASMYDRVLEPLRALAGLDRADFFRRLESARAGKTFSTESSIRGVFDGGNRGLNAEDRSAMAAALELVLPGLSSAILRTSGLSLDPDRARQLLGGLRVEVVAPEELGGEVTAGNATTDNGIIRIALDPSWTAEETLIRATGLLAHEVAHQLADDGLARLESQPFGIPTVAEEAWVQRVASDALRTLGLTMVADTIDFLTYDRIVQMEQSQALYVVFDATTKDKAAEMRRIVAESKGLKQIVVIVGPADAKRAAALFAGSGVQLARTDLLSRVMPVKGETAIEAHARLYLGTSRVRVAVDAKMRGDIASSRGELAVILRGLLTPYQATEIAERLLENIEEGVGTLMQKSFEARFVLEAA